MFNLSVTPEFLAYLLAGLVAILFDWFPGLTTWFGNLSELKKRQFMGLLLALIVGVIFGGACYGLFSTGFSCDATGAAAVIQVWLIAVGINQGLHLLTKPSKDELLNRQIEAAIKARPNQPAQGMVEYALILVLVAVVVIAALSLMGPIVNSVFETINASL
jgi:pilus assembly protein Flp/PilA